MPPMKISTGVQPAPGDVAGASGGGDALPASDAAAGASAIGTAPATIEAVLEQLVQVIQQLVEAIGAMVGGSTVPAGPSEPPSGPVADPGTPPVDGGGDAAPPVPSGLPGDGMDAASYADLEAALESQRDSRAFARVPVEHREASIAQLDAKIEALKAQIDAAPADSERLPHAHRLLELTIQSRTQVAEDGVTSKTVVEGMHHYQTLLQVPKADTATYARLDALTGDVEEAIGRANISGEDDPAVIRGLRGAIQAAIS